MIIVVVVKKVNKKVSCLQILSARTCITLIKRQREQTEQKREKEKGKKVNFIGRNSNTTTPE